MSLFLLLRRRRGGQSFFGKDFHRILDGNLRDTAGLVDPLQLFIGLGVFLILLAEIGLRIGFMAGDTLQPRSGGSARKSLQEPRETAAEAYRRKPQISR